MFESNSIMKSSEINSLKAEVKAEMLRRNRNGSLASYGAVAYDYTLKPDTNVNIKEEHYSKIRVPMGAINEESLAPKDPVNKVFPNIVVLNARLQINKTQTGYNSSTHGCATSCSGLCYGCNDLCSGGCDSGCYGCGAACSSSCTGCNTTCTAACGSNCTAVCGSSCTGGCGGICDYGCGGVCSTECEGGCSGTCNNTCRNTCSGTCSNTCTNGCKGGLLW